MAQWHFFLGSQRRFDHLLPFPKWICCQSTRKLATHSERSQNCGWEYEQTKLQWHCCREGNFLCLVRCVFSVFSFLPLLFTSCFGCTSAHICLSFDISPCLSLPFFVRLLIFPSFHSFSLFFPLHPVCVPQLLKKLE